MNKMKHLKDEPIFQLQASDSATTTKLNIPAPSIPWFQAFHCVFPLHTRPLAPLNVCLLDDPQINKSHCMCSSPVSFMRIFVANR